MDIKIIASGIISMTYAKPNNTQIFWSGKDTVSYFENQGLYNSVQSSQLHKGK